MVAGNFYHVKKYDDDDDDDDEFKFNDALIHEGHLIKIVY